VAKKTTAEQMKIIPIEIVSREFLKIDFEVMAEFLDFR